MKTTVVLISTEGEPLMDESMVQRILECDQVRTTIEGRVRVLTLGSVPISSSSSQQERFQEAVARFLVKGIKPDPQKMKQYDITDPSTGIVYRVDVAPP